MSDLLPVEEQLRILMAGTEYGDEPMRQRMQHELRERLGAGRALRVYLGVDPTAPDIHLGHAVQLRKLAQFQALGHEIVFLIGSFTARIGDPSDKDKTRPQIDEAAITRNVQTYTEQAFRILDPAHTQIRYNAEWLGAMSFADVIHLASNFTVQQFLQRDNFAKRHENGDPIHLHELFYALMQGQDAVALETDVQVGGTDQTFNMLAGRTLQERAGQKPHVVITCPMLPGTDGTVKMSKSLGNAIGILSESADMYGKLMSLPDHAMPTYIRLLTRLHPDVQEAWIGELESGALHPRDGKMRLARAITADFHGEAAADEAEAHFVRVFQQRKLPTDMAERAITEAISLPHLIHEVGFARGTGEARRLIQQSAVSVDDEKVTDPEFVVQPAPAARVLRVGKRNFLRLV